MSRTELEPRIEQNANDTDAIYDILKRVNATLDTHSTRLAHHSKTLDSHTEILGKHSKILNAHTTQLNEIKGQLDIVVDILTARS